jgi:hypothetical protein
LKENDLNTSAKRTSCGKVTTRPVTNRLHPRVYTLLIGLALWFILSVWSFAGAGVTDYLLFIVSGFIFIAVALPVILSRVERLKNKASGEHAQPSLREWASWDFETSQGRLSGMQAALQILLPIAAAAFGMTAFSIALHIAERGGA